MRIRKKDSLLIKLENLFHIVDEDSGLQQLDIKPIHTIHNVMKRNPNAPQHRPWYDIGLIVIITLFLFSITLRFTSMIAERYKISATLESEAKLAKRRASIIRASAKNNEWNEDADANEKDFRGVRSWKIRDLPKHDELLGEVDDRPERLPTLTPDFKLFTLEDHKAYKIWLKENPEELESDEDEEESPEDNVKKSKDDDWDPSQWSTQDKLLDPDEGNLNNKAYEFEDILNTSRKTKKTLLSDCHSQGKKDTLGEDVDEVNMSGNSKARVDGGYDRSNTVNAPSAKLEKSGTAIECGTAIEGGTAIDMIMEDDSAGNKKKKKKKVAIGKKKISTRNSKKGDSRIMTQSKGVEEKKNDKQVL